MAPKRRVDIILAARDEASKVLSNVANKAIPDLAKRVAGVAASFASVGAVIGVIEKAATSAMESEKATAALTAALNAQKISVQANLPHLTSYAGALSRITAADDEAIMGAQKLLISIGGLSGAKLDQATKAVLDLAAGLGIGIPEAAEKVARAANGSVKSFGQLGVKFQENATDAEKLDTVLGFIEKRFGGAAQAEVETMAGKIDLLSKAYGEFLEALGKSVPGGGVKGVIGAAADVINVITDRIEKAGALAALQSLPQPGDDIVQQYREVLSIIDEMMRLKMDDTITATLSGKFAEEADPVLQKYIRSLDAIIQREDDAAKAATKRSDAIARIKENIENQTFAPQKASPKTPITGESSDFVLKNLVAETEAVAAQKAEWEKMVAIIGSATDGLIEYGDEIAVVSVRTNELGEVAQEAFVGAAATAAAQLGDTLVDAAFGAKVAWDDALKEILKGLIKTLVTAVIVKAVTSALGFSEGGVVGTNGLASSVRPGGYADGGVVKYAAGGMFTPRGTDTVPAMLTPGEIVIPRGPSQSILNGRASIVPTGQSGSGSTVAHVYLGGARLTSLLIKNSGSVAEVLNYLDARGA